MCLPGAPVIIREWGVQFGIPMHMLIELERRLGINGTYAPDIEPDGALGSEGRQQSLIRIEAAQKNISLFRNNVGALLDARGTPVRYGLANESKKQNEIIKSADLIGIEPVLITQLHVGYTFGRFISVEVKEEVWQWSGDDHEQAQLRWAEHVISKGGRALFANKPGLL